MNKNKNSYIIIYASVMIVIVAVLLSVASLSLRSRQEENVVVEKQSAILAAVGIGWDDGKISDKTNYVESLYFKYIVDSYAVDGEGNRIPGVRAFTLLDKLKEEYSKPQSERQLPVFEAKLADGSMLYVLSVYGRGLWGPIWGYIALEDDWDTIYGAVFDHQGETPGLGAEITTPGFSGQFRGKTLFQNEEFAGIAVLKGVGSSQGNVHAVDAVSGGTITSRGVQDMLYNCLNAYLPFIMKERSAEGRTGIGRETVETRVVEEEITVENYE